MALHLLTIERGTGNVLLNDEMLIVRYPEGDCDVVSTKLPKWEKKLERALYDEYQCSEVLKEGDEFMLRGRVRFECVSFHVLPCDRSLV